MDVRESYDSAAKAYAEHLASELAQKPLDRHLLNRFAEDTRGRGLVADLGCGPGHVARYLHDQGVAVVGVDISPEMIKCAASLNPGLDFRVGDIRELSLPAASLAGLVAFYSIVHFDAVELDGVMFQLRRVLAPGGLALVSFHMGDQDQVVHVDDLFGAPVTLDFRFMHQALSPRPCGLLTSLSSNVWNVSPTRAWSIEVVVATCSHGLPNIGLQTALVDNKRRPRPDTSSSLRSRRSVRRT